LQLLSDLESYKKINNDVANAAIKSFSGHLWCLSKILVGLACFDSEVPTATKSGMVAALDKKASADHPRRIAFNSKLHAKQPSDCVSEHTRQFFMALDISQQFLIESTDLWDTDKYYIAGQQYVKSPKVVNDAADRGVALIQAFSGVILIRKKKSVFVSNHREI
jgi:hypothetical protein